MEKILITGTKGFIGKNLKKKLDTGDVSLFEINEDIFEEKEWYNVLKNILHEIEPDQVYHVGACSDTLETNVDYMMTRNVESTKIISDYCRLYYIPLVYSSSAANYGINGMYPSNLYGWSKYIGENYVVKSGGIALRYFNVYGPGEENKGRMSSIAYQMFQKHKNSETIEIFPEKPTRDFVFIEDVIDANIHAMKNIGKITPSYYDVGSGESETFEEVLKILNIPYRYTSRLKIPEGYQFRTQSNKSKWLPNWSPNYNLQKGLQKYKEYLEND